MTITQKRARLYREWILAQLANNEGYYFSTIAMGIPDGEDLETVMADLQYGEYDEYLDEMISVYEEAKKAYAKDGFFVDGVFCDTEEDALNATWLELPERIYKR